MGAIFAVLAGGWQKNRTDTFGDKRVSVPSQCALRGANYRCRPQRKSLRASVS